MTLDETQVFLNSADGWFAITIELSTFIFTYQFSGRSLKRPHIPTDRIRNPSFVPQTQKFKIYTVKGRFKGRTSYKSLVFMLFARFCPFV